MKLWILKQNDKLERDDDPWFIPEDKFVSFVVRAESESIARMLAAKEAKSGDESMWKPCNPWLSPKYSTCNELIVSGISEVVMSSFHCG